jgi:hypothetical protein
VEPDSSENRASRVKSLVHEIAIGEFPRESGSLIIVGIRGSRSQGVRVRHFRVLAYDGTTAGETMISRYPIERRGDGDVEDRGHTRIGVRHFRISEKGESRRSHETPKRDGPTVIASKWRTGGIADRESEIHEVSDL